MTRPRPLSPIATVVALAALLLGAAPLRAQTRDDSAAVRRAVMDYVEGFYEGDSTKLARAVRPEVFKYGYSRDRATGRYQGMQMKWPEFFSYAARVKASSRPTPATAPKQVVLFDVLDQTASAKLTAWWGVDYLLLAKQADGRWMIGHVLWQSPPPSR